MDGNKIFGGYSIRYASGLGQKEDLLSFQANLLSSVHDAIIAIDENMCIIYWNSMAEKISGWSIKETIGRHVKELFQNIIVNTTWKDIVERIDDTGYYIGDVTARHKNGALLYTDVHIKKIRKKSGADGGIVVSFRDVTDRIKQKQALSESEKRYQELVKFAPAGIYEIDFYSRRFLYVNDVACKLSGYSREELLQMDAFDILDDKSRDVFKNRIDLWLKGLKPEQSVDYCIKTKDGRVIVALFNVNFTRDEQGRPKGATGIIYDITERKYMEETLSFQAHLLSNVQEAISAFDENMDAVYWNDIAQKMYGWTEKDVLGHSLYDLLQWGVHDFKWNDKMEKFIAEGYFSSELVLYHKDGRKLPTEVHATIIKNDAGKVSGAVFAFRDISRRKQNEERLLKNKQREEILGNITGRLLASEDPKVIMDDICKTAMKYIDCDVFFNYLVDNEQCRLHLNACEGVSEQDEDALEWLDYGAAVCGCVAQKGARIIAECIPDTPDPRTDALADMGLKAYACHPLKANDTVIGTLAFGTRTRAYFTEDDISFMETIASHVSIAVNRLLINNRLKQSEQTALSLVEELRRADKNKNDFMSTLSHELRNPLATLITGISLLEAVTDEEQARKTKEIMKRQSAQLSRLVDDLLDVTRITSNKIKLKREIVDLNRLVSEISADVKPHFEVKGVLLETDISPEPVYLDADPVRITQAIGNLLYNALKFTGRGGYARMTVETEKGNAVVSVEDSGIGIKHEMLSEIFKPFIQADDTLDRSGGGLGLGLAIAKGIAELHEGDISAYSAGLGMGSKFTIRVPITFVYRQLPSPCYINELPQRMMRILVIDDNSDFTGLLCLMLREMGHEAQAAASGGEGIEKAKAIRPDVILCDIGLPEMSGYDVARLIRNDDTLKGIKIIALSGYAAPQSKENTADSGFDKYIAKPVSAETLYQTLQQLC